MNASEIRYIEAHLPVSVTGLPSPEKMVSYHAKVRQERNEHMARLFVASFKGLVNAVREMRRIAVACTAARLHRQVV